MEQVDRLANPRTSNQTISLAYILSAHKVRNGDEFTHCDDDDDPEKSQIHVGLGKYLADLKRKELSN
ncbi:hypothetical protein SUGI_0359160 [Cryptomeria japonica]|nr:hypothetical protein SUGI_0359160 [Cryptomeria japonica]